MYGQELNLNLLSQFLEHFLTQFKFYTQCENSAPPHLILIWFDIQVYLCAAQSYLIPKVALLDISWLVYHMVVNYICTYCIEAVHNGVLLHKDLPLYLHNRQFEYEGKYWRENDAL